MEERKETPVDDLSNGNMEEWFKIWKDSFDIIDGFMFFGNEYTTQQTLQWYFVPSDTLFIP